MPESYIDCQQCFKCHKIVMVTEIPQKGRGLVAAREIKMGELILIDKPVIIIKLDRYGLSGQHGLTSSGEVQSRGSSNQRYFQMGTRSPGVTYPLWIS